MYIAKNKVDVFHAMKQLVWRCVNDIGSVLPARYTATIIQKHTFVMWKLVWKFVALTGLDQTVPHFVKPQMMIRVIITATKHQAQRFAWHAGMEKIAINFARRKTVLLKTHARILKEVNQVEATPEGWKSIIFGLSLEVQLPCYWLFSVSFSSSDGEENLSRNLMLFSAGKIHAVLWQWKTMEQISKAGATLMLRTAAGPQLFKLMWLLQKTLYMRSSKRPTCDFEPFPGQKARCTLFFQLIRFSIGWINSLLGSVHIWKKLPRLLG